MEISFPVAFKPNKMLSTWFATLKPDPTQRVMLDFSLWPSKFHCLNIVENKLNEVFFFLFKIALKFWPH